MWNVLAIFSVTKFRWIIKIWIWPIISFCFQMDSFRTNWNRLAALAMFMLLFNSLWLLHNCKANVPRPVKVAAIFDDNSDMRHDLMFVNAIKEKGAPCLLNMNVKALNNFEYYDWNIIMVSLIKRVNKLPGLLQPGVILMPLIQKIPPDNSFVAERATCQG